MTTNPVGELIGPGDVVLDLDVANKAALLTRIADLLAERAHVPSRDVLASLETREALGSTGLGHGVAIPHARMPQCAAVAGVFVRTRLGVDFDAPDRRPVSLFLGLLVPQQATERHLKLLAAAAAMFGDRSLRESLRASGDAITTRELLAEWSLPEPHGEVASA